MITTKKTTKQKNKNKNKNKTKQNQASSDIKRQFCTMSYETLQRSLSAPLKVSPIPRIGIIYTAGILWLYGICKSVPTQNVRQDKLHRNTSKSITNGKKFETLGHRETITL
jgi:hypothetical protein